MEFNNNENKKREFINELAKRLVVPDTQDFFSELGIEIPTGAEFESLSPELKSKVIEIATKLQPLKDDEFSLLKFFNVSSGNLLDMELAYFYCHAVKELNIDPLNEKTKQNFNKATYILTNYSYELSHNKVVEMRKQRVEKFNKLKELHLQDVLDVSGNALDDSKKYFLEDDYHGNVEGAFERRLLTVMLLKSIKKFDKTGKLENVKGIGGGYFDDGDNFGINFTFNGVNYNFSDKNKEGYERIPHNLEQLKIIEELNSCCNNRYLIKVKDESEPNGSTPPERQ